MTSGKRSRSIFPFRTINAQIAGYFTALLAVIISGIIIAVILLFFNQFTMQKTEIMHSTMETVSGSIETRINTLRKLAQELRRNGAVKEALLAHEMTDQANAAIDELYTYGLQSVALIATGDEPLNTPLLYDLGATHMLELTGYNRFRALGREEVFSFPHAYPYENEQEDPYYNTKLSYFFTLRDRPDMAPYGFVQMTVVKDTLFFDRQVLIDTQFEAFYVIDGDQHVVYSITDYDKESETLAYAIQFSDDRYGSAESQRGEYAYFHYSMPSYPDWHMVGVASIRSITAGARLLTMMVVAFGVVGIGMVVLLSLWISRRITEPIKQMGDAMKIFESGAQPDKLPEREAGEVGELIRGFNRMLDDIENSIETIYLEQEEKKLAEVTALKYQIQSLQQQINPHFLYNTLNVINYLAMEKRTEEIRSFVHNLTQLLRATLTNTHDSVTMRKETSFLQSYARLMEYRYKDLFDLELDVDENTLDCMVPKLILQPLAENALLHGIFPSNRRCTITLRACCVGGNLCVSVADDGVGIPKEKMHELFEKKRGFNSIGLKNINDRLKLCYGDNFGLMISSKPGVGTIAAFYIPITREEEMYDD